MKRRFRNDISKIFPTISSKIVFCKSQKLRPASTSLTSPPTASRLTTLTLITTLEYFLRRKCRKRRRKRRKLDRRDLWRLVAKVVEIGGLKIKIFINFFPLFTILACGLYDKSLTIVNYDRKLCIRL